MLSRKNLKRSKYTTILGAGLIIAGVASVFTGNANWTEAGMAIGAGVWLMFEDDETLGISPEKPIEDDKT